MKKRAALWKTVWQFLKQLNTKLHTTQQIPLLGVDPGEMKTYGHTDLHRKAHSSTIHTGPTLATPKRSSSAEGRNGVPSRAMEAYSRLERNEAGTPLTMWMNLKTLMLSNESQTQDTTHYRIPLV